jgi:hypothetical protein
LIHEVINVLLRLAEEKVVERLPGYRPRVLEAARSPPPNAMQRRQSGLLKSPTKSLYFT